MGMKMMVSSDMPKVAPPREKTNIMMGMMSFSRPWSL